MFSKIISPADNYRTLVWPANLVSCALFNTLHSQQYAGIGSRGGASRERFFIFAFLGSFFWHFIPCYLFTALSVFSWVTWIFPKNRAVNQLFGYSNGLGMSILTVGDSLSQISIDRLRIHVVWLGANCIHWQSAGTSLVGRSEYSSWFRHFLLDFNPYIILHKYLVCALHANIKSYELW